MKAIVYPPVTPALLYAGLKEDPQLKGPVLSDLIKPNKPSGNSYIDFFAELIITHGKRPSKEYAAMLGVDSRKFDGALECMTGMNAHDWMNEYLRLVACDLLEHTRLRFKDIALCLGMSSSSFTQFFQAFQQMQPFEYRQLKQKGLQRRFFRST